MYEINNIYCCPDNIIIDNGEVKKYDKSRYLVILPHAAQSFGWTGRRTIRFHFQRVMFQYVLKLCPRRKRRKRSPPLQKMHLCRGANSKLFNIIINHQYAKINMAADP